jgi:hypothetical protein
MQIGPLEQATSVLSIIPIVFIVIAGVFVAMSGVVIVLVILVVSNRAEPDSLGRRPLAVYFFGISFIATFIVLFGTFAMVLGLVQLIGSHSSPAPQVYPGFPSMQGGPIHPVGDAVARVVVLSLIVTGVAVVLLVTHLRRALALPEWVEGTYGPVSRVAQSYIGAVTFVAVTIAASSIVFFAYDLCRAIAPGVFELSGPTVNVVRALIASFYLAAASILVIFLHSRIPPGRPSFWWTFRRAPSGGPSVGTRVPGGSFADGAQTPSPLSARLPPPPPSGPPPFSAANPPAPQ